LLGFGGRVGVKTAETVDAMLPKFFRGPVYSEVTERLAGKTTFGDKLAATLPNISSFGSGKVGTAVNNVLDNSPVLFGGLTIGLGGYVGSRFGIAEHGLGKMRGDDNVGQVRGPGRPDFNHAGVGLSAHYNRH
jgi:hypothetical protein